MKKYTILFLLFFFGIVSCKKANEVNIIQADKILPHDAKVISKGNLMAASLPTLHGVTKIYLQTNGKYGLGLEQMSLHGNNDLSVYFSASPGLSLNAIK